MKPLNFPEATVTFTKPAGWTDDQCSPLPVCVARDDQNNSVRISCWKPTLWERLTILFGRPVWLHIVLNIQPPVSLSTDLPFQRARRRRLFKHKRDLL